MSNGGGRIVRAVRVAGSEQVFEGIDAAALENLERRTTAFLYAIWELQGVKKRIIKVESNGYYQEPEDELS
jgi:hypothetical protein